MMPAGGRNDPYGNFNFRVDIEDVNQSMFSEIILPEARADVVEYREGGELTAVRKLPGRIHFGNLILRWGTTTSRELYDWWRTVQDGQTVRKNVSVILLDESRNEVRRWTFRQAWPMRYQAPVLNAQGTDVVIETLEIAHEGMDLA